jgi:hypothetical protein
MTWMTWRQHRGAAAVGAALLAAIAAALVGLGITARSKVRHLGLTACLHNHADCSIAVDRLQHQYHWLPPVAASMFALPLLAGMFWGAPLIAREIETGTYRLAWTQSVSRLRWISTKLALVLGVTAIATLALGLLATWAFQPLIPVLGNRFRGGWFDVQGIVPAAYMLFALALGATIGAVWRKTIPAMATTIVGFAAVRIPIHNLRRQMLSPTVKTFTFPLAAAVRNAVTGAHDLIPRTGLSNLSASNWIQQTAVRGPDIDGTIHSRCPNLPRGASVHSHAVTTCVAKVAGINEQLVVHYLPAGTFWTLQAIEAAIYLALTAALVAICLTVVVRSRPH